MRKCKFLAGVSLKTFSPLLVEIAGLTGFDIIFLDREHTFMSWENLELMVLTASSIGLAMMIRVEEDSPVLIRKVFEISAYSVMIPHVCTREDAVKAVEAAKFPPNGIRSASSGLRCAHYRVEDWPSFVKWSNENTMVSILIGGC